MPQGHRAAVNALTTHCGLLISGSADQSVRIWDLESSCCVGTLWQPAESGRERDAVQSLAMTTSGTLATGCWGGAVRLWDLHRSKCLSTQPTAHNGAVWALLHAESRLFSAGSDGVVRVWDHRATACTGTLGSNGGGAIYSLADHDGLLVTGGYDQLVKVWDYRMMRCLRELPGHTGSVRCLAFKGSRLLSGSTDGMVRLWEICAPAGEGELGV